jgi:hypothetical protein
MARRKSTKDQRSWGQLFAAEARRFHEDEEGATLVFAAATFFALAMSIAFVFQIGTVSADRLQIQGAADAAAYSGALVEANSLNAIGQINDGITYVNYIAMRHAIDGVVYSLTLNQYTFRDRVPTATGKHGYVIMGGDEDEGNARINHVKNHFDFFTGGGNAKYKRLQDTLRWRTELYYAGVTVMFSTPGLVRSTAAEVAAANGASHIGFSDDMDRAWRLGDTENEGFTDRGYVDDDKKYSPAMYERYEGRDVLQLDVVATSSSSAAMRELPRADWFVKEEGSFKDDYYQIRLCWRKEDWDHGESSGSHQSKGYFRYNQGDAPNAHWHHPHSHSGTNPYDGTELRGVLPHPKVKGPLFLEEGGHSDEDVSGGAHSPAMLGPVHSFDPWRRRPVWEHHAIYPCTNCNHPGSRNPELSPSPDKPRSRYAEIMATSGRRGLDRVMKFIGDLLNQPVKPYQNSTERLPGPLVVRESLLRSGVTVMTYRRGRGLGKLFPESPWGMVGLASAQIGVETANGVTPLRRVSNGKASYAGGPDVPYWANSGGGNNPDDYRKNLFYDVPGGQDGFHFSARLVPVARELTWHSENEDGSGLRQLLRAGRWYPAGKLAPNAAGDRPPIDDLNQFLQVNNRKDLEAFWH